VWWKGFSFPVPEASDTLFDGDVSETSFFQDFPPPKYRRAPVNWTACIAAWEKKSIGRLMAF
jgi:hypothetical protein